MKACFLELKRNPNPQAIFLPKKCQTKFYSHSTFKFIKIGNS